MSKYKLIYFDFAGLAEATRWIFKLAHVDFEEESIPYANWEEHKSRFPTGQVPVIYEDDKEMTQSGPMERYLCQKFGFVSPDPFIQFRSDQVGDIMMDTRPAFRLCYIEEDPEKKEELRQKFLESLPPYLNQISKIVDETPGHFIGGDQITYGDFKMANLLHIYSQLMGPNILDNYPTLKNHLEAVISLPEIKEWINRPNNRL